MHGNSNSNALSKQLYDAVHNRKDEINMEKVKELLNRGASPSWKGAFGDTTLHYAVWYGYLECLELFVKQGTNVNEMDNDGRTSLHDAVDCGHFECCEFLLKHGANVNAIDKSGATPLHYATGRGSLNLCKLLILHKANVNIKDCDGFTPLLRSIRPVVSLYDGNIKICKYLFQCGAILYELPKSMKKDKEKKRYKALQMCWKWWFIQESNGQDLIDIPSEIFKHGSEAVDIYFKEIETSQRKVYRSRVCIIGPSGWGKTSLVKSLISGFPEQEPEDLRTIGIDQFQWKFNILQNDCEWNVAKMIDSNSAYEERNTEFHQVSFWDFAGQDIYKGAHSIFFSSARTLFLICVDLQVYDEDIKNDRNTASDEILRWLRLVFAKQPDAKLIFIGTKADLVDEYVIEDIQADVADCVIDWCNKCIKDINNRQSLFPDNSTHQHNFQRLQIQLTTVKDLVNGKWVITSSKDEVVLKSAITEIQRQIRDSNLGFVMPDSYTAVLKCLYKLRKGGFSNLDSTDLENFNNSGNDELVYSHIEESDSKLDIIFCSQQDLKRRIRRNLRLCHNNEFLNDSGLHSSNRILLDEILKVFHDLGEILLFNSNSLYGKDGLAIINPSLMIDLVRDLVQHDLCGFIERSHSALHLEPGDWKAQLKNGYVYHAIFEILPMWSKLTNEQKQAAKELLHEYQVLYPIGVTKFGPETNVVVPALWLSNQNINSLEPSMEDSIRARYAKAQDLSRLSWEYEFSVDTLPESFFQLFIVKSYHSSMERNVRPNFLEVWTVDNSSLGHVKFSQADQNHYIITIEVASITQPIAVQLMQYILSVIENLLREYPGVSMSPYFITIGSNRIRTRHVLNGEFLSGRLCSSANYNWLDENLLLWYYELFSMDNKDLLELSKVSEQKKLLHSQREEKNNASTILQYQQEMKNTLDTIIQILCIGEENRQLPALWTAELEHDKSQIRVRMLSDISGKCFHADKPIQIGVPYKLLSKYGNKLNVGLNIISHIDPNAIRWDKVDLSNIIERAMKIHNLIDGCDLQKHGIINTTSGSAMSPDESKLLLMDLLTLYDPKFTLRQIPRLSGLVSGFVTGTGYHLWGSREEFAALGNVVTVRNSPSVGMHQLLHTQKYIVDLRIRQVDGLTINDQKKAFVKWELLDGNNNNDIIQYGITTCHKGSHVAPSWPDTVWHIRLIDFNQLKGLTLKISVQRYRKIQITKLREFKGLGNGAIQLIDILQYYHTTPSVSIPIRVEVLENQTKMCTVCCQFEFPVRISGNNSSTTAH